jgi:23S rRNA pseudouridine1911/1915/1917 synthase
MTECNACQHVLFEDNHLIAVNKRPSDIVQTDHSEDTPMTESVKQYLKEKYDKPGDAFLGVIHRIDRPVSGVVLFAKTSKALERMNALFKKREVVKKYWAVVKTMPPEQSGHLIHYLIRNRKQNKSYANILEKTGSVIAELKYEVMNQSDRYILLEIELLTGRHHQIRAQLAAIGCPIKGDLKYGFPRSNPDASIHLHARELSFLHPVKNETVRILAKPPDEVIWNYFFGLYAEDGEC